MAGALLGESAPTPAVAAPSYTRNEPAIATASPSLVYLEITYTGYVRDTTTGQPRNEEPLVFQRRCTGVVVDHRGDVLTTSVCVRPSDEIILVNALNKLGRDQVTAGKLAADQLDNFVNGIQGTSAFSGPQPGTKADEQLWVQTGIAVPRTTSAPAFRGTVVTAQPATEGDVAVVRLQGADLPAIEFDGDRTPEIGDSAVILGYGPGGTPATADDFAVRAATVKVTGRTASNRLGVSAQLGPDSRGGAVVDTSGRLIALLDTDTAAPGAPNHDMIIMAHLKPILAQAGGTNQLTAVDRGYRNGLAAYFAGQYTQAIARFDGVIGKPASPVFAENYRARAVERLRTEGEAVPNEAQWPQYALAAALGIMLVILTTAAARLVRLPGRRPGRPSIRRVRLSTDTATATADTVVIPPLHLRDTVILPRVPDGDALPDHLGVDRTPPDRV